MNAGNLDSRIILKTQTSSSIDIHGQVIPVYSTSSLWTKAKSANGSEGNLSGVDVIKSSYQFTIRHTDSVTEESVIIFNGYEYNIRYIDSPFGRGQWLIISADRIQD